MLTLSITLSEVARCLKALFKLHHLLYGTKNYGSTKSTFARYILYDRKYYGNFKATLLST